MTSPPTPSVRDEPSVAAPRLLICSSDGQRRTLLSALARATFATAPDTHVTETMAEALAWLAEHPVECVVSDDALSDGRAMELLAGLSDQSDQPPPVIVLADTLEQAEAAAMLRQQVAFVCPLSDPTNIGFRSALQTVCRARQTTMLLQTLRAQNEEQRDHLQGIQKLDPLTGLINSQYFYGSLEREFRRSARSARPLSLIVADIDCFAAYNFSYGQEQGDRCLRMIADATAGSFQRAGDVVARMAGASMAVLLMDTDSDDVATQAERLREKIWNLELLCNSSKVADRVTLSVGVATVNVDFDRGWDTLLQTAQNALLHAKNQGRNWVEVAAGM